MWRAKDASAKLAPRLSTSKSTTTTSSTKKSTVPADRMPPKKSRARKTKRQEEEEREAAPGGDKDNDKDDRGGMFEFAYGIAHDGGGVLKCKWAPEAGGEGSGEALGLLAGVFYDGSLR